MSSGYAELDKPTWTPPAWIFCPVWTVLYVMMGFSAWLVWRQGGWKTQGFTLGWFLVQWLFNVFWTPLLFGAHLVGPAFVDIVLLWLSLAVTLRLFWRVSESAATLLIPYLAWVSFAAVLNFRIWYLNP